MLKNLSQKNLILGSGSPRRANLLREMQLDFEIRVIPTEEDFSTELLPFEIAEYLAKKKSNAFLKELKTDDVVITADTIVSYNDKILNKPQNLQEAKLMLENLSGTKHEVITGVAILSNKKQIVFHSSTQVTFSILNGNEIDFYLNHFEAMDKAGAYGIQDWIGIIGVKEIKGSYYNVVGLPTNALYNHLKEF